MAQMVEIRAVLAKFRFRQLPRPVDCGGFVSIGFSRQAALEILRTEDRKRGIMRKTDQKVPK